MGSEFTIPGMSLEHGRLVAHLLQKQLGTEQPDSVTQDMLIEQSAALEKFQWQSVLALHAET